MIKRICFTILVLITTASCNEKNEIPKNKKLVQIDENRFEFLVPISTEEVDDEWKEEIRTVNKNIAYLAMCQVDSLNCFISASIYTYNQKDSMDHAFEITINTVPSNMGLTEEEHQYKLMDYKTYKKKGKKLRYKISRHFGDTYTIMFYFMKEDYANTMYEIKLATRETDYSKSFDFIEEVALSANFK